MVGKLILIKAHFYNVHTKAVCRRTVQVCMSYYLQHKHQLQLLKLLREEGTIIESMLASFSPCSAPYRHASSFPAE